MDYFERYKSNFKDDGETLADAFLNASTDLINDSFEDSPTYSRIYIGDKMYDVRITDRDKLDEKLLLLRPNVSVKVGNYAIIKDEKWLVLTYDINKTTPTSIIKRADRLLKWNDEKGNIVSELCVIESVLYEEVRDGKYFFTPKGNMRVYTQFNEKTRNLYTGQRFIFGSSAYKIGGLDDFSFVYDGFGYLTINLERTENDTKDNFIDGIAYNQTDNPPKNDGESGGGGWL